MMVFLLVGILWSVAVIAATAAVWRAMAGHAKVYWLIALHGLYASGVYVLYGWVHHLPLGVLP